MRNSGGRRDPKGFAPKHGAGPQGLEASSPEDELGKAPWPQKSRTRGLLCPHVKPRYTQTLRQAQILGPGNSHAAVRLLAEAASEHLLVFGHAGSWLPPGGRSLVEAEGLVSGCGAWAY